MTIWEFKCRKCGEIIKKPLLAIFHLKEKHNIKALVIDLKKYYKIELWPR